MTARVLVVDDIAANVKLLEARLSAEYFTVLTANSPGDALAILRDEHVDVVLLDVMMPGMNGFEVCRRIKSAPKTMHVPVIMVSALDQASDKVQGLEAGADDFLTKPVDDIALITRVKNLTRLKSLNDELMRATISARCRLPPPIARSPPRPPTCCWSRTSAWSPGAWCRRSAAPTRSTSSRTCRWRCSGPRPNPTTC